MHLFSKVLLTDGFKTKITFQFSSDSRPVGGETVLYGIIFAGFGRPSRQENEVYCCVCNVGQKFRPATIVPYVVILFVDNGNRRYSWNFVSSEFVVVRCCYRNMNARFSRKRNSSLYANAAKIQAIRDGVSGGLRV